MGPEVKKNLFITTDISGTCTFTYSITAKYDVTEITESLSHASVLLQFWVVKNDDSGSILPVFCTAPHSATS